MELTQPQQVFCRMAEILLESKMTPAIAQASLTKFFLNKDKKRTSTILVIDEVTANFNLICKALLILSASAGHALY
jgi:hypothetical protein